MSEVIVCVLSTFAAFIAVEMECNTFLLTGDLDILYPRYPNLKNIDC